MSKTNQVQLLRCRCCKFPYAFPRMETLMCMLFMHQKDKTQDPDTYYFYWINFNVNVIGTAFKQLTKCPAHSRDKYTDIKWTESQEGQILQTNCSLTCWRNSSTKLGAAPSVVTMFYMQIANIWNMRLETRTAVLEIRTLASSIIGREDIWKPEAKEIEVSILLIPNRHP